MAGNDNGREEEGVRVSYAPYGLQQDMVLYLQAQRRLYGCAVQSSQDDGALVRRVQ
jgi:hypothetical protein